MPFAEKADQLQHNEQDEKRPYGEGKENPKRAFVAFNSSRNLAIEHAGVQDAIERYRQHKSQDNQGDSFRQGFPAAGIAQGEKERNQGGEGDQDHGDSVS
ncbi:MAG: hypothetical protein J6Y48_11030, partial [Clostridia bacterium]|nr:hypothetical protein [Clostridia bacterium]